MFTVYFQRSNKELIELGQVNSLEDVSPIIKDFLDKHNYTSYYTRLWHTVDATGRETYHYDVGSHTEFFLAVKN